MFFDNRYKTILMPWHADFFSSYAQIGIPEKV